MRQHCWPYAHITHDFAVNAYQIFFEISYSPLKKGGRIGPQTKCGMNPQTPQCLHSPLGPEEANLAKT
jgi:hypothetical protein